MHHWLFLLAVLIQPFALATQLVRVGVAEFPPYIEKRQTVAGESLHVELLELMNAFQSEYRFVPVATGTVRRFQDFDAGKYDMSSFDNLAWGWGKRPVVASEVYLRGGEVYVALAQAGRDQRFFDDLAGKRMIGMLGYHYGFAGFKNDASYLRKHFRMSFSNDNASTLKLLLAGRGDIAVVTEAYLAIYLKRHPALREQLLISERKDQEYAHTIILRQGIRPSVEEINTLLRRMRAAGVLAPLWRKYGAADD
ncbi:substrate-binding periplasmic protein [Chitinimonas taiwanensis]|uniref:Amino acid ABC transporter substrate-binding protein, PAAT family n=1 Tax=Chitinimonas taiwanensis DSM 18899 TaxID=1121279 RepID=A0A1K2HIT2_9NEIS|nr:transporter substrate-binding domain-containing protein [Chitinimonas taiwanensis]SFZ76748.1 amino acid ABC transporter substrate-binding protein, PAAT family [Chitinimonas taiwanensis DSM 18899]